MKRDVYTIPPYSVRSTMLVMSETVDWGLKAYGIPQRWLESLGKDIRVGVLDTGIDPQHPDLADAIEKTADFTNSRYGWRDVMGHGTHVSGIIGARRNQTGIVGVAPECRLLVGKVLGDDGSGTRDSVQRGINWAIDNNCQVICMSLGSPQPSSALQQMIRIAARQGVVLVCAAGNDGIQGVNYPARWEECISVGSVDKRGEVSDFSSRGKEVDLCAPGEDILSSYLHGGYAKLSGTSMATPFVVGVIALAMAQMRKLNGGNATLDPSTWRRRLQQTARDAGEQGFDFEYGFGLVDPEAIMERDPKTDDDLQEETRIGPLTVNGASGYFVFVPDDISSGKLCIYPHS